MTQMNIVVSLPSGDVNVPVQSNSTPGHLKENIKYSLGVIPKNIKLTCEGRVLDDFKPLSGEPNNVNDGANIVASVMEGAEFEAAAAKVEKPKQPTMIRKEEPPKPKKPKKEVSRPVLADGDVVKKDVLGMVSGSVAWTPQAAWMEPKSAKRHLA